MSIIRSKAHTQDSDVFDALSVISFPAVALTNGGGPYASATVQGRIPLPVGVKIQAVSVVETTGASGISFNVTSGEPAYEGALAASGISTLQGRNNAAGTISCVMPGPHTITTGSIAANTSAFDAIQTVIDSLNADGTFGATYYAYYAGIQNGAPSLAVVAQATGVAANGRVFTFSSTDSGFSFYSPTTILAGGAAAGGVIVVAPNDTTASLTLLTSAAPGNALFSADQAIPAGIAGRVRRFYPVQYDAVFSAGTELTLRLVGTPSVDSTYIVSLLVKTADLLFYKPEFAPFTPNTATLA